ncbi:MAG: hypothetical protein HYS39_02695 [Proteobacteria bacterium]|nr:hypothetical protein [Pseudomonadota bacterium]
MFRTAAAMVKWNKMIKKILFILIAVLFVIPLYIFFEGHEDHVSVEKLSDDRSFVRKAHKNESKLYKLREENDPAFVRRCIIPTSEIELDVVIPLIEKDLEVVKYTLQSVRKMVGHKIGNIYLISPESEKIRLFAQEYGCEFVLEDDVLPSQDIKKYGGWIVQQFLKLNADFITQHDHYLVVDADTVFLRPLVFAYEDGAYLVNTHWDCSTLRKRTTALLLGNKKVYQYDFVSHHMFFSKTILKAMKEHIERRFQKRWDQAILDIFEKNKDYRDGFSEYDLYITYLTEFSNVKFKFVSNANITVYRNFLSRLDQIMQAYSHQYKSVSLHHFVLFKA